jgi:hypothetical protein
MKFKVGDKVKYGSGDLKFYGTVSAVVENSISPCYRLSIERMENNNYRLSMTQFEFEIEADDKPEVYNSETDRLKKYYDAMTAAAESRQEVRTIRKPKVNNPVSKPEPDTKPEIEEKKKLGRKPKAIAEQKVTVEAVSKNTKKSKKNKKTTGRKPSDKAWEKNFEMFKKGEKSNSLYNWITKNRSQYNNNELDSEKIKKLTDAGFSFEKNRKKKTDSI